MLRDRIIKSANGFKVVPDNSDEECGVFFGTYGFRDSSDYIPDIKEMKYWDPYEGYEQQIDYECLVYVEEKKDGVVKETCRFYIGRKRGQISTQITAARKYGEGAYKITVTWPGREPFNSDYIFLYNRRKPNEKYYFLSETVRPLDDKSSKDEYIFYLTGGENADQYEVGYEPLLLEKYDKV